MPLPWRASNQKCPVSLVEISGLPRSDPRLVFLRNRLVFAAFEDRANGPDRATSGGEHEREELGVNRYTTPRIDQLFEQLDKLQPLPFDQLWRPLPAGHRMSAKSKGLVFGGLVAEGS